MVPLLLLTGCLEKVTGEEVPLDPRFYEGKGGNESNQGDPNAGGTGDGAYVGYKGETVKIAGVIVADEKLPVQIDVNELDATQPGGTRRAGALHLNEPGTWEIAVPASLPKIQFQAFQDPNVDGPDATDPFAQVEVDLSAGAPAEPVTLTLVVGGRGGPNQAGGLAQPGQQPGQGPVGQPSPPPTELMLPEGPRVTISGTVEGARADLPVVLDFFRSGASGERRSFFGKHNVAKAGDWSVELTAGMGLVEIEAYQDLTGDSRSGDDPFTTLAAPIDVGDSDIEGLTLTIPSR
jgi:hypothetical protein